MFRLNNILFSRIICVKNYRYINIQNHNQSPISQLDKLTKELIENHKQIVSENFDLKNEKNNFVQIISENNKTNNEMKTITEQIKEIVKTIETVNLSLIKMSSQSQLYVSDKNIKKETKPLLNNEEQKMTNHLINQKKLFKSDENIIVTNTNTNTNTSITSDVPPVIVKESKSPILDIIIEKILFATLGTGVVILTVFTLIACILKPILLLPCIFIAFCFA